MNEREEFLRHFRSEFITMVERLDTMTESELLDGIQQVKAARNIYKEEFNKRIEEMIQAGPRQRPRAAWTNGDLREQLLHLVSIQDYFTSAIKLRSRTAVDASLGSLNSAKKIKARASFFDSLEDALNERLESLRKKPGSDSSQHH